jgi:hypothetical protein
MNNFTNSIKLPMNGFAMIYFPKENYVPAALVGLSIGIIIASVDFTCRFIFRKISGKLESDEVKALNNALDESTHYGEVAQLDIKNLRATIEHLKDELTFANQQITFLKQKNSEILRILGHEHTD